MARLTQPPRRSVSNPDSIVDLSRLLSRLQQSILHADAERERRLRTSEYERNKVGINLQYARNLLTTLEQDALAVKVSARRQETQADLNQQRDIYEKVAERLRELEELSIDSDDGSSDEEDLLGDMAIPTPSQSSDSRSGDLRRGSIADIEEDDEYNEESTLRPEPQRERSAGMRDRSREEEMHIPDTTSANAAPTTITSSTLRPRTSTADHHIQSTAETTALRSQLFGDRPPAGTTDISSTAEAIMDHHRQEQDQLTESMVAMARALKQSTHAFGAALREDQDVLAAAGKGLDKNETGLQGIAGKMGNLRSLTEGKGWLDRMKMYAMIAGLSVTAILIVFVLPKLRF
ncbi:hypothetical protein F5Y15DRAFT_41058 [Xylariaceae sp. FL0016]|nr:hypothetical protein F5Y15DRAFT_41058 [Xylariaceae sp. FL0016]